VSDGDPREGGVTYVVAYAVPESLALEPLLELAERKPPLLVPVKLVEQGAYLALLRVATRLLPFCMQRHRARMVLARLFLCGMTYTFASLPYNYCLKFVLKAAYQQ
jgi:hypothetical protein